MLAFITGSGFYDLPGLEDRTEESVRTTFGVADVVRGRLAERPVAFLARHGHDHSIPPHRIDYRANVAALAELGASAIVATAVSGGINPAFAPGDLVAIDDFVEFTKGRAETFFDGNDPQRPVVHTDVTEAYSPRLRALLCSTAAELGITLHPRGTYACMNGPRFESPAEIRALRTLGADLVGMTGYPEVVLAAELAIPYASIGVISNPAAGLAGDAVISLEEILATIDAARGPLLRLLTAVAARWSPDAGDDAGDDASGRGARA